MPPRPDCEMPVRARPARRPSPSAERSGGGLRRRHARAGIRPRRPSRRSRRASSPTILTPAADGLLGRARLNHHTEATSMLYAARECARRVLRDGAAEALRAPRRTASRALARGPRGDGARRSSATQRHKHGQHHRRAYSRRASTATGCARAMLDDFGIEIGTSFGPLRGRIWRIGTMGYSCRKQNVLSASARWRRCCGAPGSPAGRRRCGGGICRIRIASLVKRLVPRVGGPRRTGPRVGAGAGGEMQPIRQAVVGKPCAGSDTIGPPSAVHGGRLARIAGQPRTLRCRGAVANLNTSAARVFEQRHSACRRSRRARPGIGRAGSRAPRTSAVIFSPASGRCRGRVLGRSRPRRPRSKRWILNSCSKGIGDLGAQPRARL